MYNAESPTLMYIYMNSLDSKRKYVQSHKGLYKQHPHEAFPLLCS